MTFRPLRRILFALFLVFLSILSVDVSPARADHYGAGLTGWTICLDPGHGGDDPGYVTGAMRESDVALDVALALRYLLQHNGATVAMTRAGDVGLSAAERVAVCNAAGADLLISIHFGASRSPSDDGAATRHFQSDDRALAQKIQQGLMSPALGPAPSGAPFADLGLIKNSSPVLRKTGMPAAQAEPGLLSNPAEVSALAQRAFDPLAGTPDLACALCRRARIVNALYFGVLLYVGYTP